MALSSKTNYISLFSGVGGLDLALGLAVPTTRCICYVERDIQAATVLAKRITDSALDDAPIWSDITTFNGEPWCGLVDGIIGGFPCQDLSTAGKQDGIQQGNRSGLFYEYTRIIREVQPRWVIIENVPAVIGRQAGEVVFRELSEMGFHAEWGTVFATDVGANHRRERVFILAWKDVGNSQHDGLHESPIPGSYAAPILDPPEGQDSAVQSEGASSCVPATEREFFAPGPQDPRWGDVLVRFSELSPTVAQSVVCGVDDGLATALERYNDRIRACGNGVVALQGAFAIRELTKRAGIAL